MASIDLVFAVPLAGTTNDLVFGAENATSVISFTAALPPPTFTTAIHAEAPAITGLALAYTVPSPTLFVITAYDNATPNRMHAKAASGWQDGDDVAAFARAAMQSADALPTYRLAQWTPADPLRSAVGFTLRVSQRSRSEARATWAGGVPAGRGSQARHRDLASRPAGLLAAWQDAVGIGAASADAWNDRSPHARPRVSSWWQEAARLSTTRKGSAGVASALQSSRAGRWTDAMKPLPGYFRGVVPELPKERCYYPPFGNAVHLLFDELARTGNDLLFICGRVVEVVETAIIPVRRVYLVINNVRLHKVDGGVELPVEAFTLSLDADSWTFGFTATMPESVLATVTPAAFGSPVELDAEINGEHFRLLAERIGRERSFGRGRISVTGRGISAMLATPYSPVGTFGATQDRTAQQLVNDVLTINGVSLGWSVDWRITDWVVPVGAFSHQGPYVDAVNAIVGAAGAYVQPHPTAKTLIVLPRYPVAPWTFGAATPDLQLPSAAVEREGIAWQEFPEYNSVYVSGAAVGGILAQVKRTGSAGDKSAPMVVDPLITADDAARQRGMAVLGKTGTISTVSLTLPVLPESGIIKPGKLVRYMDGAIPRNGVSRGVNIRAEHAKLTQTIELEVH